MDYFYKKIVNIIDIIDIVKIVNIVNSSNINSPKIIILFLYD
ncbi:hypothetical protein [Methanothermococcus okinawensis]|nr:hypothetical protein [Methanothermococcus okinawensis]